MKASTPHPHPVIEGRWGELIPPEQWEVFQLGCALAQRAKVEFLLGGAMALATYTGRWRNTKDIDFIVRAEQREAMMRALRDGGFSDYYEQQAYDRSWIFRGFRDGVIFDVIWTLPNHRVDVDDGWFDRARRVRLRGETLFAMPIEELIRVKLYVLQRERCDWVDVLNALGGSVERVDWDYLVERMGRDISLLHGVLAVFNWMSPGRAAKIPGEVRERFGLFPVEADDAAAMEARRVRLFDSRPWFAPLEPEDRVLER